MKLLHTSDWHLGRSLYGRKRYEEFAAFLDWLAETIVAEQIDLLLVAGDIFDTTTPSNRAQELYYRFLCRLSASSCRHAVIIAGNHDSPSFLDAPKELLRALQIHAVGSRRENPQDEVLLLRDGQGAPECIVCAVPYLRDRDVRRAEAGESIADKEQKLLEGIRGHYAVVAARAEFLRREYGPSLPLIGMGHLFTAGGQTVEGDGVRELYVGSLVHLPLSGLPDNFDYLALGHLHVPQTVGGREQVRYSGSPLPMGFGEARQQKSVCQVEFHNGERTIKILPVPEFQHLEVIRGDWETMIRRLEELRKADSAAWLELIYEGEELIGDLRERLEAVVEGSRLEILRMKDKRIVERLLEGSRVEETLDDLDQHEVFARCLAVHEIPEEQRPALIRTYQEVLQSIHDEDPGAE